ncbi:hypothetical protein LguiA_036620 [Lonicera macranthoides]
MHGFYTLRHENSKGSITSTLKTVPQIKKKFNNGALFRPFVLNLSLSLNIATNGATLSHSLSSPTPRATDERLWLSVALLVAMLRQRERLRKKGLKRALLLNSYVLAVKRRNKKQREETNSKRAPLIFPLGPTPFHLYVRISACRKQTRSAMEWLARLTACNGAKRFHEQLGAKNANSPNDICCWRSLVGD